MLTLVLQFRLKLSNHWRTFMFAFAMPKRPARFVSLMLATILTISVVACSGSSSTTSSTSDTSSPTTESVEVSSGAMSPSLEKLALEEDVTLNGAGATFPAPLYQRWFQEINQEESHLKIHYQGVGSGAGVEQFLQKTTDFGASDVAMTDEEICSIGRCVAVAHDRRQRCMAYNLPNLEGTLSLPREVYTKLLLGDIS
jgi:phosphate transport system substrate-binding protein